MNIIKVIKIISMMFGDNIYENGFIKLSKKN